MSTSEEDPYPSDDDLEELATFASTPLELIERVKDLWWPDDEQVDVVTNDDGSVTVRLVTVGWSGNEAIVSALRDNVLFWNFNWESSNRGGLHTFLINPVWRDEPIMQAAAPPVDDVHALQEKVRELAAWREDVVDLLRRSLSDERFVEVYRHSGGKVDLVAVMGDLAAARSRVLEVAAAGEHAESCATRSGTVCDCWKVDVTRAVGGAR